MKVVCPKCGDDQILRVWNSVTIVTPCEIRIEDGVAILTMDFSEEEQCENVGADSRFECANCFENVPVIERDDVTETQYE